MATPKRAIYNCSQSELYTICLIAWDACLANIPTFTTFSALYTSGLVAVRKADILAAAALPDFQARNAAAQLIRTALIAYNDRAMSAFMMLKEYIKVAFNAVDWNIQFDAAGQSYYRDAGNLNWDSTAAMLVSMSNFVAANSVALLANSNMPAGFVTDLSSAKISFDTNHLDYMIAKNDILTATDAKIDANNQIYTSLAALCSVARGLNFSWAVMANFTISRLLTSVSGGGFATLEGYVTDVATGLPIAGAKVEIPSIGVMTTTDGSGFYTIAPLPAASFTVLSDATGYTIATTSVTLTGGTTTTLDIALSV